MVGKITALSLFALSLSSAVAGAATPGSLMGRGEPARITSDGQLDVSVCVPYCLTTVTTEGQVLLWLQDKDGRVVYTHGFRPDWKSSPASRPFPGERVVETVIMPRPEFQQKSPGNSCGDGWGYTTGDIVSARTVGTQTIVITYTAGGQGVISVQYGGDNGHIEEVSVMPTQSAETSPICSGMRATHSEPK